MMAALLLAAVAAACHTVDGDKVRGSDLAAASEAFRLAPADAVAGFSPMPGMRRVFDAGELLRFAHANRFEAPGATALCFERAAALPDAEKMQAAMRKTLGDGDAQIEITEVSQFRVPSGELVFPRDSLANPGTDGTAVWNGYVAYEGGHFPLWARLRLSVRQRRLAATQELKPGHVIAPDDVRIDEVEEFPSRIPALVNPEDAVGKTPRRTIASGAPVMALGIEEPNEIERGDTLIVEARSGAAVVKIEGKAETAGKHGQTISIRNPVSGKLFRGRVEAKGRALVECEAYQ